MIHMRPVSLALPAFSLCCVLASTSAQAAVSRDQFPPRTTGDLLAICSAGKDDPLMTASVNFCQGFTEGVVEVALSYGATVRKGREPFCLPTPRPTHNEALARFETWVNADSKRLSEPPVLGLMQFLVSEYPCPHSVATRREAK